MFNHLKWQKTNNLIIIKSIICMFSVWEIVPLWWWCSNFALCWRFGHLRYFETYICVGDWSFLCISFSAEEIFESVGDRELRQVFEGQNRIHLEIKQLNRQLDMILDEQRRYVSSLTEEISKRGAGMPGQHGQVGLQNMHMCLIYPLLEGK